MNYSGISECDVLNGNGFRVALFVSGCSHKCYNCQNHETWNKDFGHPFTEETKQYLFDCLDKPYIDGITITGGDPLNENNIYEVYDLINEINNRHNSDKTMVENASNHVKMCINEHENVDEIRLSLNHKTIWLYSGYYWEEIFEPSFTSQSQEWIDKYLSDCELRKQIINQCDVMVDGRYVDSKRDVSISWRGSTNQRVIDIKKSLEQNKIVLYCD